MIIVTIFLVFARIGLFAIGGAYSFLPLLERELVEKYSWLSKEEFLDILGLVRMFPGAISIKYATYVGYKVAGVSGAIAANLGNILVPAALILFAFGLYNKHKEMPAVQGAFNLVNLAVFAMIIAVAFRLVDIQKFFYLRNILVVVVCFILFVCTKIHPALIIVGVGILGALFK